MKQTLKQAIATGTLLLAGTSFSLAASSEDTVGAAFAGGGIAFLIFWIATAVVMMGIYGKKWLARYEDLQLPEVVPAREGSLAENEPDIVEALWNSSTARFHEFTDIDDKNYTVANSYQDAIQVREDILATIDAAGPLTEKQAESLNELIRLTNFSLLRGNGRVALSKAARVIVWIYWGLLALWLLGNLVRIFAITAADWSFWESVGSLIALAIVCYAAYHFFSATRIVYRIPMCDYTAYRDSLPVSLYSKAWQFLTHSTIAGTAAAGEVATTETVTVYEDSSGNLWVKKDDPMAQMAMGCMLMALMLMLALWCGGILFFVIQPILMMWLFKKYFIDYEKDPGPDAPLWERPKFPIWGSLAAGAVIGLVVFIFGLIAWMFAPPPPTEFELEMRRIATNRQNICTYNSIEYTDDISKEMIAFVKAVNIGKTEDASQALKYRREIAKETLKTTKNPDAKGTALTYLVSHKSKNDRDKISVADKVRLVKELIDAGADVNVIDSTGNSALAYAVSDGNYELAKTLVDAGAKSEYQFEGETRKLWEGVTEPGMRKLLNPDAGEPTQLELALAKIPRDPKELRRECSRWNLDYEKGNAREQLVFADAIASGNIALASEALKAVPALANTNVQPRGNKPRAAFIFMFDQSSKVKTPEGRQFIKELIAAGADINALNPKGRSALFCVDSDSAKELIDAGANVNLCDADGISPLENAVINKNAEITKILAAAGADANTIDSRGETALSHAVRNRDYLLAEVLINAGAKPEYEFKGRPKDLRSTTRDGMMLQILNRTSGDSQDDTPETKPAPAPKPAPAKPIVQTPPQTKQPVSKPVPAKPAAKPKPITPEQLKEMYTKKGLTWRDGNTYSALVFVTACAGGDWDAAANALKNAPSIAKETIQVGKVAQTPLIFLASRTKGDNREIAIAKSLVANGTDVNAISSKYASALYNAAMKNSHELAKALISMGAKPVYPVKGGQINIAKYVRDADMVKILQGAPKK